MASKLRTRKSWREKLEHPSIKLPKVVRVPAKWRKRFGSGTMAIPHPLHVDALIRSVRKGRVVTQAQLRARLAKKYRVNHTCPLTTGIFVRIAAEAADEARRDGRKSVTPYWRVLRDDGSLNEKFPGGPAAQSHRLRAEGFTFAPARGKRPPRVLDFGSRLARL